MQNDIENQKKLSQGEFIKWVVLFMLLLLVGYFLWGYKLFEEKIGKLSQDKSPNELIKVSRVSQLEKTCKKLSAESEFDYEAVVGRVTGREKYPSSSFECFHGEGCPPINQSLFIFALDAVDVKGVNKGDFFSIYTNYAPNIPRDQHSAAYMLDGGVYHFCGRRMEWYEFLHTKKDGRIIFKVDYPETISLLTPPDSME